MRKRSDYYLVLRERFKDRRFGAIFWQVIERVLFDGPRLTNRAAIARELGVTRQRVKGIVDVAVREGVLMAQPFGDRPRMSLRSHREKFFAHNGPGPWPCFFCGNEVHASWEIVVPRETSLVVHHIDGNSSNGDPANLAPAHWSCHTFMHGGKKEPA